jgi:hypothetical protein
MVRRCETIQWVVMPAWAPPDTSTLRTLRTGSSKNRAGVELPSATRSSR